MFNIKKDDWKQGVTCSLYTGKDCDGKLHSVGFIINEDTLTEVGFRCRCNKCGEEIILNFDPDAPVKNY